ncbi:MAG: hypothetical protein KC912_02850 [Proteobacteria bacterium]|nr:hypothetical protein [Pseudomonadota bacterium]
MGSWRELVHYVGFEPEDSARLAVFWPTVQPHTKSIVDGFYSRVMAHDGTRRIIKDDAQLERLRASMGRWLEEMISGPHDDRYFQRRAHVGHRHVEVGLPPRYVSTAMAVIVEHLTGIALSELDSGVAELLVSVRRITTLDAAVMTNAYMEQHELEQLRTLQDLLIGRLPVTVLLLDAQGGVISATRPTYRLFGSSPMLGLHWRDALPPELIEAAELGEAVERARMSGRDIRILRADTAIAGQVRQFRIDVVPLQHEEADVLLHIEELTDAIDMEARLQRSEALAKLGELSAAVAHEIRNPLAGISGAVQVLSMGFSAEDPRRAVMQKVQQQIKRLNGLVTELLAFARPADPQLSELDLHVVAREVAELLPGAVEVVGEGTALADPHLVEQILLNLGVNGLAAGERVRLTVEPGLVRVEDDGPGVEPSVRGRLFEPFVTTKTQGTGLGLAVSKKAASSMGGGLELLAETSGLGGATFLLRLRKA